jgi:predicted ATPase
MRRFIITGAPGAGKTAILRQLERDGFGVVEEAATDVIAAAQAQGIVQPWTDALFVDAIVALQRERQLEAASSTDEIQFHDRSAVCTAALAEYLGYARSPKLINELERISKEAIFERRVFFVRTLGFITRTEARQISFDESLRFERIHEDTYRAFGFDLISVAAGPLMERVAAIKAAVVQRGANAPRLTADG